MALSRREFLYLFGGGVAGVAGDELTRAVKEGQFDTLVEAQIDLSAKKFEAFKNFGVLEKNLLEPGESLDWDKASSIMATNREGDVEMIIPAKPKITRTLVVKRNERDYFSRLRLVRMTAEFEDYSSLSEKKSSRLITRSSELYETLDELPRSSPFYSSGVEVGYYFHNVPFWISSTYQDMSSPLVKNLRLGVRFSQTNPQVFEGIVNQIEGVENAKLIGNDSSRALGDWAEKMFDLPVQDGSDGAYSDKSFISEITTISVVEATYRQGYRYFVL